MSESPPTQAGQGGQAFGPNAWLVDEMYEQYRADPDSVAESWRDFFEGYRPGNGAAPTKPAAARPSPPPVTRATQVEADGPAVAGEALRGAAARLALNMEASLAIPTATSIRVIPARLLEVNRTVLNNYLVRTGGAKVSFTHLIGYAVVRAVAMVPAMNAAYLRGEHRVQATQGDHGVQATQAGEHRVQATQAGEHRVQAPQAGEHRVQAPQAGRIVRHPHVGLGLAVDVPKADGTRTLLVPAIRNADTLDFRGFHAAYEELIRKVRSNKVSPDDFAGVTMTLTNPGTLGTVASVPRLMPGQGVIIGVGVLDYPAEFQGADPARLADLGLSKVLTLTSTYDHRIIQGAESGLFLARIHELLLGEDDFYGDVFRSVGVPYEPVKWRPDRNPISHDDMAQAKQVHVQTLINMYRVRGHLIADLDPLGLKEVRTHAELDPATYHLTIWDLEREFFTDGLAGQDWRALGEILGILRDAYCRRIGVEYMHIQEPDQKRWIQLQVEGVRTTLDADEQKHILDRLNAAEAFERFLHTKYVGHKRFGMEGAESAIPLIDELLDRAALNGAQEAVLGMAHRGRLNVLVNIVGKSLRQIFREFEGDLDPATTQGSGDVKYHVGAAGRFIGRSGIALPVTLASNPSHLEAVDPVVEGMVRAKQDLIDDPESFSVLPIVIHGDAAFAGQGVVAETLNLSALRGYRVGGTIHLVINNQLGFTTAPAEARSSFYATDVAKTVQAPIFHVNGDDPEACIRVARLAHDFRQTFHKDVVIDMVCYRRHGHNEGDDPSYTQPLMYKRIEARRSVRKLYTETLVRRGDITIDEAEKALEDFLAKMQLAFEETRQSEPPHPPEGVLSRNGLAQGPFEPSPPTGVAEGVLDKIVDIVHEPPAGFAIHPKLAKQLATRLHVYAGGQVDWALAETLAFGSLLLEGTDVRLSGQDTRRGTFSQRHSVLVDYQTATEWTALHHLGPEQAGSGPERIGKFWAYDSLLSEYAALGFEYGYSVVHRDALVVWEAQFGDFANGAQIIIDQFLTAAEDKWGQSSGLVLLLPHGFEGQGPEHSSARVERFLTLCAEDNIQVVNPTTAAQYFHLLRRQVRNARRRPLIVLTPKSLLRARQSRSAVGDLTAGSFAEVLDDTAGFEGATRIVLASGKVAYDLMDARDTRGVVVPVVRIEQLYPWPEELLLAVLDRYPSATEVVWVQEEPENMGPWPFVHVRLHRLLRDRGLGLRHVSRLPSASPASGSHHVHDREQAELLDQALG